MWLSDVSDHTPVELPVSQSFIVFNNSARVVTFQLWLSISRNCMKSLIDTAEQADRQDMMVQDKLQVMVSPLRPNIHCQLSLFIR